MRPACAEELDKQLDAQQDACDALEARVEDLKSEAVRAAEINAAVQARTFLHHCACARADRALVTASAGIRRSVCAVVQAAAASSLEAATREAEALRAQLADAAAAATAAREAQTAKDTVRASLMLCCCGRWVERGEDVAVGFVGSAGEGSAGGGRGARCRGGGGGGARRRGG